LRHDVVRARRGGGRVAGVVAAPKASAAAPTKALDDIERLSMSAMVPPKCSRLERDRARTIESARSKSAGGQGRANTRRRAPR